MTQVFLESWNHRVNVTASGPECAGCLDVTSVLQKASAMDIEPRTLWGIPEHDGAQYSQARNTAPPADKGATNCGKRSHSASAISCRAPVN